MKLGRRIVERNRHAGHFLNRGNQVRQKVEHFLRPNHDRLRAVDVEREVVGAEVGLQLGESLVGGQIVAGPRPRRPRKRVVDQFADQLKRTLTGRRQMNRRLGLYGDSSRLALIFFLGCLLVHVVRFWMRMVGCARAAA